MSTPKLVSVLMAAYNAEDYVAQAIESILRQSHGHFELLVTDDGSTDRTRAIIDAVGDPRIRRLHNESNLGLVKTWNRLLQNAKGDYITWQDADDISDPDRLRRLVDAIESNPRLMVCGSNYVRKYPRWRSRHISQFPTSDARIRRSIEKEGWIPFLGASKMIRREVLDAVPGFRDFFDRVGWEDFDFILRVLEKHEVGNLPDVLYEYRYIPGSASRRIDPGDWKRAFIHEIGMFLARQRAQSGVDGLMEGGDSDGLRRFLAGLAARLREDPSAAYRLWSVNQKNNKDYPGALRTWYKAITLCPRCPRNHALLIRILGSALKSLIQVPLGMLRSNASLDCGPCPEPAAVRGEPPHRPASLSPSAGVERGGN